MVGVEIVAWGVIVLAAVRGVAWLRTLFLLRGQERRLSYLTDVALNAREEAWERSDRDRRRGGAR